MSTTSSASSRITVLGRVVSLTSDVILSIMNSGPLSLMSSIVIVMSVEPTRGGLPPSVAVRFRTIAYCS